MQHLTNQVEAQSVIVYLTNLVEAQHLANLNEPTLGQFGCLCSCARRRHGAATLSKSSSNGGLIVGVFFFLSHRWEEGTNNNCYK